MISRIGVMLLVLVFGSRALAQDVESGPEKGKKVPALKVFSVSGPIQGDTVDYAAQRKGKETIYLFIQEEKFSRPMHQFMRELEKALAKEFQDGLMVAVWLTDDQQKTKAFLPKITQHYDHAALSYFPGEKAGPKDWFINDQADITVILAHKDTVIDRFGYNSVNDTTVREVMKALSKGVKK